MHVYARMCNNIYNYCYCRTTTDNDKMRAMLGKCCDSTPELQSSIYLQLKNKSDDSIIYRAEIKEILSQPWKMEESTFQVKEFWCPKPLVTCKGDFLCFGRLVRQYNLCKCEFFCRAHDVRVICRRATNEMSDDIKRDIETVVKSFARNKYENYVEIQCSQKIMYIV